MTEYGFSLTYTDSYGNFGKVSTGTEEQMFATADAIIAEGGVLTSVYREVYEVANGYAHLTRLDPYFMGKPQIGKELDW